VAHSLQHPKTGADAAATRVSGTTALDVSDIRLSFGGVKALDGASFEVPAGHICGLIGPNGAGKTSLFNCISRTYVPQHGAVRFESTDVLALPRHRIAHAGIGRTFQHLGLYESMTVRENIQVGTTPLVRSTRLGAVVRSPGMRRERRELADSVENIAEDLALTHVLDADINDLSHGTLKRVELARALVSRPRLLLLDEPASGLTHGEVDELKDLILQLRDQFSLTVVIVEHHLAMIMAVSDQVVAMDSGRVIAAGKPEDVRGSAAVVASYFGAEAS
jgi:branched-chain amino acid transport system ATP-binding protein